MNPTKLPKLPMLRKTFCMVLNSRPGPWLYSMPKAAQAGRTAQAAMTAIRVSQAGIMSAFFCRFSFLSR